MSSILVQIVGGIIAVLTSFFAYRLIESKAPVREASVSEGFALWFRKRRFRIGLIELLIVTAVVLIVAAIAIPNLLQARISANEARVAEDLLNLNTQTKEYAAQHDGQYPPSLDELQVWWRNSNPSAKTSLEIPAGYQLFYKPTVVTHEGALAITGYEILATPTKPIPGDEVFRVGNTGAVEHRSLASEQFLPVSNASKRIRHDQD